MWAKIQNFVTQNYVTITIVGGVVTLISAVLIVVSLTKK